MALQSLAEVVQQECSLLLAIFAAWNFAWRAWGLAAVKTMVEWLAVDAMVTKVDIEEQHQ
ncbi:hypothetical protein [Pseudomonas sp. CNPSo 3701]|uniref:hypothetical protein n=1 Tax=Pseudomonas sp. CNPSo 3701 TaxID=3027943 RepID=UPI002363C651|nr:hypothetical protein [Pseudomonas sp. CNPSo 3701]MDD1508407.1 hypothetical protein [Pseudomonas sp. CNPSo 3701]